MVELSESEREERIVQVSGFGVNRTSDTQCDYMLVAVTNHGRVVMSRGDGDWNDIGPAKVGEVPNA